MPNQSDSAASRSQDPTQPRSLSPLGSRVVAPRFLSVLAAATILGTSEVTLYRAIHSNQFPAIKIRGRYVIPAKVLDAMEDAAMATGSMVDAADWVDGNRTA